MGKKIKITESQLKGLIENVIKDNITEHNWGERKERRFRSSIYVDIFVPETDSIENDREEAQKIAKEISNDINYNSYVGGTAHWGMKGLLIPKDELDRL